MSCLNCSWEKKKRRHIGHEWTKALVTKSHELQILTKATNCSWIANLDGTSDTAVRSCPECLLFICQLYMYYIDTYISETRRWYPEYLYIYQFIHLYIYTFITYFYVYYISGTLLRVGTLSVYYLHINLYIYNAPTHSCSRLDILYIYVQTTLLDVT